MRISDVEEEKILLFDVVSEKSERLETFWENLQVFLILKISVFIIKF